MIDRKFPEIVLKWESPEEDSQPSCLGRVVKSTVYHLKNFYFFSNFLLPCISPMKKKYIEWLRFGCAKKYEFYKIYNEYQRNLIFSDILLLMLTCLTPEIDEDASLYRIWVPVPFRPWNLASQSLRSRPFTSRPLVDLCLTLSVKSVSNFTGLLRFWSI